jgi:succinate dehydrogenase flavin-adding protein (antitoxin of CptAB toxin-antitoxin module)
MDFHSHAKKRQSGHRRNQSSKAWSWPGRVLCAGCFLCSQSSSSFRVSSNISLDFTDNSIDSHTKMQSRIGSLARVSSYYPRIVFNRVFRASLSDSKDWKNEDQDMSNLPGLSPEQLSNIARLDDSLRNHHMATVESDEARRKRMIYRSKQRGWLEADLLMGSWAVKHVPSLSLEELDEYEVLLKEETIDIYNYISGKDALPPHLQNLSVMKKIQGYAMTRNMANPEDYEAVKKETNLT